MTTPELPDNVCSTCNRTYPAPAVFCAEDGARLQVPTVLVLPLASVGQLPAQLPTPSPALAAALPPNPLPLPPPVPLSAQSAVPVPPPVPLVALLPPVLPRVVLPPVRRRARPPASSLTLPPRPPLARWASLALVVLPLLVLVLGGVVLQRTLHDRTVDAAPADPKMASASASRRALPDRAVDAAPSLGTQSAPLSLALRPENLLNPPTVVENAALSEASPRDRIAAAVHKLLAESTQKSAAHRYARAARLLAQAETLARGRKRRALRAEIYVARGQLYEAQGQQKKALAEYSKLLRIRVERRSASESAVVTLLSKRFGRLLSYKGGGGRCRIREEWREPGRTLVAQGRRLRERVALHAGQVYTTGECGTTARLGRGASGVPIEQSTATIATRLR